MSTGKKNDTGEFSFRRYAWRQFRRNKPALLSLFILIFLVLVALVADLIATNQPWYAKYKGKAFYPAFQTLFNGSYSDSVTTAAGDVEHLQFDITDWRQMDLEKVTWAPIPYSPSQLDPYNRNWASPGSRQYYKNKEGQVVELPRRLRHFLGTDRIGADLASGIIHGTRISLRVGLVAMSIAAGIGLLLGALAGYYGDFRLRTFRVKYYLVGIGVVIGFFYAFIVRKYALQDAADASILAALKELVISIILMAGIIALFALAGSMLGRVPFLGKRVTVPVDSYISRGIEILDSMPRLILIISVAALFREKSLYLVMAIIGLTSWTGIARLARAEFLRNRNLDYIEAARALGLKDGRIMMRHALPNAMAPVFISIAFGIASAILVESSLSFLGIGVPDDTVTWGSLLSSARQQFDAWWMVLFPGLAIFVTVTVYNLIGEGLRDALDPRLKQ
jgi:peptide/nickel transport system permease protein